MWDKFSNLFSGLFGGSTENTLANGFGVQQATTPALASTWDSGAFKKLWNSETPFKDFSVEQASNLMNSPSSSLASGASWGANPYQAAAPDWWSMQGAFGNGQTGGWAMPALQGLQSMFSWTQGNKALDLARDQFDFSKEMTQKNLANQTSLLNTAMQDRQNARRSASSSYQDTDSYMKEHGL